MNALVQANVCKELQEKSTLSAIQAINRLVSSMGNTLDPVAYSLFQKEVVLTLLQIYRYIFSIFFII